MSDFKRAYRTIRPPRGHYFHLYQAMGAVFLPAYNLTRKNEGFYANDPHDIGGETYAGVARALNPVWSGWPILDAYKKQYGPLMNNQVVPGMEPHVESFYQTKWKQSRAGEIVDQDVANIYFDFYILAARAVATMQEVLNGMGQRVTVDNLIGPETLAAINRVNPKKLYQRYKEARIEYHQDRVARGLVSASFLPGWIARTEAFPDLWQRKNITGLVVVSGIAAMAYPPSRKWIFKQINRIAA